MMNAFIIRYNNSNKNAVLMILDIKNYYCGFTIPI